MTTINAGNFSFGLSSSLEHLQDHDVNAKLTSCSDEEPGCGTVPPGYHGPHPHGLELSSITSALDNIALNPQPLPPREEPAASSANQFTEDEQCGTVTRWIEHLPPIPPHVDLNSQPESSHGIIIIGG